MKVSRFLAALLLSLALVSGVLIFRPPGNFTASAANSVTSEVSTSGFAANESVRSAATEEDGPWANKLTQQQLELTDILLENPELSYGMRLVTQSTLAELGDVSMLMSPCLCTGKTLVSLTIGCISGTHLLAKIPTCSLLIFRVCSGHIQRSMCLPVPIHY